MTINIIFLFVSILGAIISFKQDIQWAIVVNLIIVVILTIDFILMALNLSFHPLFSIGMYTIVPLTFIMEFGFFVGKNRIIIAAGILLSIVIIAVSRFVFPAVVSRTVDDKEYVCVYSKLTGVGFTYVEYYEVQNFMIVNRQCDFIENYGIIFCSWRDIFQYEPISVEYNNKH